MQDQLTFALMQSDLAWEHPQQNRQRFAEKIAQLSDQVDVIVLPEMFTSGFTMNAELVAESMDGDTVLWMQNMAKTHHTAIVGSLAIKENNQFFNRLIFVEPSGILSTYNKRHGFSLVSESAIYTSGKERLIVNYKGWKICPLICYDLRFPVWSRNTVDYDVLLYVANWPKPRVSAWDALLKARAIENMSYCIGVNRVGIDGVNAEYAGHSACYDVLGNVLTDFEPFKAQTKIVTLEKRHIEAYRAKFNFLADRDSFTIL